jgi:hypothetical protein
MPFEDLTLELLRAATKEQIITRVTNLLTSLSRKRLCEFIWTIKDFDFTEIKLETLTVNHNVTEGQLLRVYERTDILGNKTGSTKTEWTYYPTGEVDTITTTELDALDQVISVKTLKHFRDGREPAFL